MRIVFTNTGSVGDVQPLVVLAQALAARGHEAVFALNPFFREFIEKRGFGFHATGPMIDMVDLQQKVVNHWLSSDRTDIIVQATRKVYEPVMQKALPDIFADLRAVCRSADMLISGHIQPTAAMVHELTQIPFASVQVSHFGGADIPLDVKSTSHPLNELRAQYQLPPVADPLREDANSPQLALYAMSRHVRPPDPHWPSHYHAVGFFSEAPKPWTPPDDLAQFMSAGDPPIAITFGSMVHHNPEDVTDALIEGCAKAGYRAVLQSGWSGLGKNRTVPEHIYVADFIAHHWLFDRVAAVVHHGGAGTTAAVWRAGKPGIHVPHAFDQGVWAQIAADLGLACEPLPIRHLSAAALAQRLEQLRTTPALAEVAESMRLKMDAEGGATQAADLVEKLARKLGVLTNTDPTPAPTNTRRGMHQALRRRRQMQSTE